MIGPSVVYLGGGPRCNDPPLWPDHENFLQATLYEKGHCLPFSSKNCKIQQCFMVFFSYRYNMRLKSPRESASDMTLWFSAFSNFRKKWANWTFKSKKCFSFRGASSPLPPDQGLCPWTPLGAPPPDPRYRLALYALAMALPLPNPKYATDSLVGSGCG